MTRFITSKIISRALSINLMNHCSGLTSSGKQSENNAKVSQHARAASPYIFSECFAPCYDAGTVTMATPRLSTNTYGDIAWTICARQKTASDKNWLQTFNECLTSAVTSAIIWLTVTWTGSANKLYTLEPLHYNNFNFFTLPISERKNVLQEILFFIRNQYSTARRRFIPIIP